MSEHEDLGSRIRSKLDRESPPISIDDVVAPGDHQEPPSTSRRRAPILVSVGAALLVAIAVAITVSVNSDKDPALETNAGDPTVTSSSADSMPATSTSTATTQRPATSTTDAAPPLDESLQRVRLGDVWVSVPVKFEPLLDPMSSEGDPGGGTRSSQLYQAPDGSGQINISVVTGGLISLDARVQNGNGEFVDIPGIDHRVLLRNSFGVYGDEATEGPVDLSGWYEFAVELDETTNLWLTTSSLSLEELTAVLQTTDAEFHDENQGESEADDLTEERLFINSETAFIRQGRGAPVLCASGGDSAPVLCDPVYEIGGLDLAEVEGAVREGDEWSWYSPKLIGVLRGDTFAVESYGESLELPEAVPVAECNAEATSFPTAEDTMRTLGSLSDELNVLYGAVEDDQLKATVMFADDDTMDALCDIGLHTVVESVIGYLDR